MLFKNDPFFITARDKVLNKEEIEERIKEYSKIVAIETVKDYKFTYDNEYPDRIVFPENIVMLNWDWFEKYEEEFFKWQFLPENLKKPLPKYIVQAMSFKYRRLLAQFYLEHMPFHEETGEVYKNIDEWFNNYVDYEPDIFIEDYSSQKTSKEHPLKNGCMSLCYNMEWKEEYEQVYHKSLPILESGYDEDPLMEVKPHEVFLSWGARVLPHDAPFFNKKQIQSIQRCIYGCAENSLAEFVYCIDSLNSDLDSRYDTGWVLDGGPWKWLYEERTYLNAFLRDREDPQIKEYNIKMKKLYKEYKKYLEYDPLPSEDLDLEKEEEYDKKVEEFFEKVKELDQKYLGM